MSERPGTDRSAELGPAHVDPEEFRRLGYWVVDRTAEHLRSLRDRPVITTGTPQELDALLGGPLPMRGADVEEGLALLADVALEYQQHGEHPRYFARVPGPSSPVAVLGDWLATGMQAITSSWGGGSGTVTLELVALGWLRDALGLAPQCEGVMVSGGSMASATALITARAERGPGVLYLCDQTHSSIRRAAAAMGWPSEQIRVLPSDAGFRLAPPALREAVTQDVAAGRRPAVVVATVGTTNTGAADDIAAIADLCAQKTDFSTEAVVPEGIWLHVDGAFGGPAALLRHVPGPGGIAGLDRVDSFVLDPHKWLFQPYDLGCVWVARPGALERTFAMHPEYLADAQGRARSGQVDLHNRTLELSRRSRGAKLWLTLRTYGVEAIALAVRRGVELGELAHRLIEADSRLSVVTPAQLGVVTFVVDGLDDAAHSAVAAAVTADGYAAITSTVLAGRTVLRLCTINPRTTEDDLATTLALITETAGRIGAARTAAGS